MRALGAPYTAAMLEPTRRPVWRVQVTGWGGVPDPFDLTPWVTGIAIRRSLREIVPECDITLNNGDGEFDPLAGVYAAVIAPGDPVFTVEMGEVLAGVPTYWTVYTGRVVSHSSPYDTTGSETSLRLGPRSRDLTSVQTTSGLYGADGMAPATWQANDIVEDLFTRHGGLAPADFNLSALAFPIGDVQFDNANLLEAAAQCLQPKGYRLWFDYDGRLTSGLLIPAAFASVLTIPAGAVERVPEITLQPPVANRIMVAGGPAETLRPEVGEGQEWAKSSYGWDHPGDHNQLGGGDCEEYKLECPEGALNYYGARYRMVGPQGQHFRRSFITNITFQSLNIWPAFNVTPDIDYEWWNDVEERQECFVMWESFRGPGEDGMIIAFTFEVWGYPYQWVRPSIDVQTWDDDLIVAYGERKRTVQAPLAHDYDLAERVANDELILAQKSVLPGSATLRGCDLRIEPNDVVTITRPTGGAFDLWVHSLRLGCGPAGVETMLEGYCLP